MNNYNDYLNNTHVYLDDDMTDAEIHSLLYRLESILWWRKRDAGELMKLSDPVFGIWRGVNEAWNEAWNAGWGAEAYGAPQDSSLTESKR